MRVLTLLLLALPLTAQVSTVAGIGGTGYSGDGLPAVKALLGLPNGLAVDASGNLYIADSFNQRIRRVDAAGQITTFAGTGVAGFSGDGGPATAAKIALCETAQHQGITVDAAGNVYFTDCRNQRIRKVDPSGVITTVFSDGLNSPYGVATDTAGNLYIADTLNGRIRKLDRSGSVTTVGSPLSSPSDVAVDRAGNVYAVDLGNQRIVKANATGGFETILADAGTPGGIAVDASGNVYVADRSGGRVMKRDSSGKVTTLIAGAGTVSAVTVDDIGNVFLADSGNGKVLKIAAAVATPVIRSATNGASFAGTLAPGALGSLFGTALALGSAAASTAPLPVLLGRTSVTVGGVVAPLVYVSPTQINFQVPWNIPAGSADVVVSVNGTPSQRFAANVETVSPAFFTAQGYAIAINPDGTLAAPAGAIPGVATRPAKPGAPLLLYANGLGLVNSAPAVGANSGDMVRRTLQTPLVLIGGVPANVTFSGLSPEFVGVNQINVVVPAVAAGVASIQMDVAGVRTSDKVVIAIAP